MKAIIIGIPGNGKSTLSHYLTQVTGTQIPIVHVGSIRRNLSIHAPHKDYPEEVSPENIPLLTSILDVTLKHFSNVIIEGYGLNPVEAQKLARQNNAKLVMLYHRNTSPSQDVELAREYDRSDKWTHRRPNDYLLNLWGFYKTVEKKWINQMPEDLLIDTSSDFDFAIAQAASILLKANPVVQQEAHGDYSLLSVYDNMYQNDGGR